MTKKAVPVAPWAYVAGPMRGIPHFNFEAFDEARDWVNENTRYDAVSPADLDRVVGIDEDSDPDVTETTVADCLRRDFNVITNPLTEAIFLMHGWENSTGANKELFIAQTIGIDVYVFTYHEGYPGNEVITGYIIGKDVKPNPKKLSLELGAATPLVALDEARSLVYGAREGTYGEPWIDFGRTAKMWEGYKGVEFTPEDVGLMMVLLKVSRLAQTPDHHDSVVDIAGYAETVNRVQNWRKGL